jgi:hypothetical protein
MTKAGRTTKGKMLRMLMGMLQANQNSQLQEMVGNGRRYLSCQAQQSLSVLLSS